MICVIRLFLRGSISIGILRINTWIVGSFHAVNVTTNVAQHKSHIEKFVHRKLKDLVCQECSKAFSWRSNLAAHVQRIHLKMKNKLCNICDTAFYSNSEVDSHVQWKHGL